MPRPYEKLLLTLGGLRVVLGAVVMITFSSQYITSCYLALGLIVVGQITDHLDGFIARKYSEPTPTGYLQDSIADKLFQFSILIAVTREYDLPLLIIWGVFCREILVLAIRIIKQPTQASLQSLKLFSILYACFLRGALILLVASPVIAYSTHIDLVNLRSVSIGMACASLAAAAAGLSVSFKKTFN